MAKVTQPQSPSSTRVPLTQPEFRPQKQCPTLLSQALLRKRPGQGGAPYSRSPSDPVNMEPSTPGMASELPQASLQLLLAPLHPACSVGGGDPLLHVSGAHWEQPPPSSVGFAQNPRHNPCGLLINKLNPIITHQASWP